MTETEVAIVGAGISGLAVDRELRRRGLDTRVLEARDRPGGVVRSVRVEGRVLDAGPQRTRLTAGVEALVDELGLRDRIVRAPRGLPLFVCRDGRLRRVPSSVGEFLTTGLLSPAGKLRLLLEPVLPSARAPARPRETVASYLTRRLGREAHRYLVGPLYAGIYGSDPADMLVGHSLGRALERAGLAEGSLVLGAARRALSGGPPPAITFAGGMAELTDALHVDARERVELSRPVTGLRAEGPADGGGPGWRVATAGGEIRAREVVLACPADEAARILEGAAPGAARRLRRLRYNRLAVVHLVGDCYLEGFGYQMALPEATATRGVTWNDALFGRDGVYTAFLGGAPREDVLARPDDELGEIARGEFREVTGCGARVLRVGRARMPARDASWTALEDLELPPGLRLCAAYVGRAGIPGRLAAARRTAAAIASAAPREV